MEDEAAKWKVDRLDEFLAMTKSRSLSTGSNFTSRRGSTAPRSDVLARLDTIERILDVDYPQWRERRSEWTSENYEFEAHHQASIRCRSRIVEPSEVGRYLEPRGPRLAANELHPWVWDAAKGLWSDGHHQDAVAAAAEQLDIHVCAKVGSRRRKGASLYQNVYSTNDPKPGEPRLRPPGKVEAGTDTWRSLIEGSQFFGRGASALIRNIATHERGSMSEQECAEALAALSILARRVDADKVELADDPRAT